MRDNSKPEHAEKLKTNNTGTKKISKLKIILPLIIIRKKTFFVH